ncbi:MAG: hypothetical protein ACE5HC_16465 [Candidatus Binatia bacterium]
MGRKVLKVATILLGALALSVGVWFFSVWIVFVGPASWRNETALKRLRDRGYLPADAREILVKDSHGGFHGDGTTFIVVECSPECLRELRAKINKDYDYRLSVSPHESWRRSLHDDAAKRTLEITADKENDDSSLLPDIGSKGLEFRCIGRIKEPFSYCTTLYIIDHAVGRFWYMNITT